MKKEQTIILIPVDRKEIIKVKEELILEGRKRRILNSTIITVNQIRNTVSVTSDCEDFIRDLSSSEKFKAVPVVFPSLN
jgi:hypothetical protein